MGEIDRREEAIRLLKSLCEAHGASGCEDAVRRIFRDELKLNLRTDKTGNIFHESRGAADLPRIMVCGHMDEVGFVVQTVAKSGLIKIAPVGGWWSHVLLAHRVRIRTRDGAEIPGVVGAKPPHLLTEGERDKVVKIDDMFIDIGAANAEEVYSRFGIRLGDPIVPESPFTPLGNSDYLLCKAFDNRVGMALTIQTLQLLEGISHPNTVCGVGTVQEEVGVRGAQTAPYTANPDAAIVLEAAPADDFPSIPEDDRQGSLGKGPQIRLMDPSAIMNRDFARYAIDLAEKYQIPHQVAVRKSGGTDARAIHLHNMGVPTIVLGVPARYIHTPNSVIRMDDYLHTLELVLKLIESLDETTVNGFTAFAD